jgi:hypothetical protein
LASLCLVTVIKMTSCSGKAITVKGPVSRLCASLCSLRWPRPINGLEILKNEDRKDAQQVSLLFSVANLSSLAVHPSHRSNQIQPSFSAPIQEQSRFLLSFFHLASEQISSPARSAPAFPVVSLTRCSSNRRYSKAMQPGRCIILSYGSAQVVEAHAFVSQVPR